MPTRATKKKTTTTTTLAKIPTRFRPPRRVKGRLPASTPVLKMGLEPAVARKLTPRASKLTKRDLVNMWAGKESAKTLALTVNDINSIRAAFGSKIGTGVPVGTELAVGDINCCCCCCPCCCAESVTAPVELALN